MRAHSILIAQGNYLYYAVVDLTLTDLPVAEESLRFRIKCMVENYIQSLTLVYNRISRYSGTPYLHFPGIGEKLCKFQERFRKCKKS
jgi:hypothetical protein